jgi:hypothetical protein
LLAHVFGAFEPHFLENLANYLPPNIPCCWTGPSVVSKKITIAHVRKILKLVGRPLILWDNYPVNDLSMKDELHLGPLKDRDPHLPQVVYGYLNNPLVQEELSFIPLATCFDYAANPVAYNPEKSWHAILTRTFGYGASKHWRAIRTFCERVQRTKRSKSPLRVPRREVKALRDALDYLNAQRQEKWAVEIKPWKEQIEGALKLTSRW